MFFIKRLMESLQNFIYLIFCQPLFMFIPDKIWIKIFYKMTTGKKLNLKNPKTFNEKIQWTKIYDRNNLYTSIADKYAVRKYVAESVGDKYLIPLLGCWDSIKKIDYENLPKEFVIKTNHDSGTVFLVDDKDRFDVAKCNKILQKSLHKNYFRYGREWAYKNISPMVLAEELLKDDSMMYGGGGGVLDYKLFCFSGKVKYVQVDIDRKTNHRRNIYDSNWNLLPVTIKYPSAWDVDIPKPVNYEEMIYVAETLSKGFPHLRVDLYNLNGTIYFGELTLYHGSGTEKITPESFNIEMGNHFILREVK